MSLNVSFEMFGYHKALTISTNNMNPNEFVRLANKIMNNELKLTKLPVYKRMFYRAYVRRITDHLKESKDNTIHTSMVEIMAEWNVEKT